ncbi:alpha/beta fold hydrolase [Balneatrix alpica]|uniref:alpha/beta fold hydrolase n=1 Tax=Balneatrix alpica TaxID=75684 RepID=UPI0027391E44|nr:alpha/beta fold hydrolase [Balneatrix alpica]
MVNSEVDIVLLHGAGAGHGSAFLLQLARELSAFAAVEPLTLAYMQEMEASGRRRPPPRFERLQEELQARLDQRARSCWLVGKSMGGRLAMALRPHPRVCGAVALGYPLHPPGKKQQLRLPPLQCSAKPGLILQGQRDPFGQPQEFVALALPSQVQLQGVEGADHDWRTPVGGMSLAALLRQASLDIATFIKNTDTK